jgi:hypothetical protein
VHSSIIKRSSLYCNDADKEGWWKRRSVPSWVWRAGFLRLKRCTECPVYLPTRQLHSLLQAETGIHKVLAANRGEIAVRIFRAAKELGCKTVRSLHSAAVLRSCVARRRQLLQRPKRDVFKSFPCDWMLATFVPVLLSGRAL